jgi:NAD(P)H-dependent FMN reductase
MKLAIFNGSPRGTTGNSALIIDWLTEGMKTRQDIISEVYLLNRLRDHERFVKVLKESDIAIIVFPLYTDAMPGITMAFFERLEDLKGTLNSLKLGFVVHSGFPEACQSRHVEKYLEWLTGYLGAQYLGTAIMGNSEGMKVMPPSMTQGRRSLFAELGRGIALGTSFASALLKKLSGKERLSRSAILGYKLLSLTGLTNWYWNSQLKRNKAYDKRFAKPYAD